MGYTLKLTYLRVKMVSKELSCILPVICEEKGDGEVVPRFSQPLALLASPLKKYGRVKT